MGVKPWPQAQGEQPCAVCAMRLSNNLFARCVLLCGMEIAFVGTRGEAILEPG